MITARDLKYRYPGSESDALRGVSFRLEPGERMALMGANGSGKTTLARCLNGLLKPSSGSCLVDGLDTAKPSDIWDIRRRVGFVFQNPDNQIVATTVDREIAFGLENLGIPWKEMHERVERALERFHLEQYRSVAPHLLSGGERQRLALAAVWVMAPQFFVLDEPTSLLDPRVREEILRYADEEVKERGAGFLLITQYPDEALACDRLLVLHEGLAALEGTPAQVFREKELLVSMGLGVPVEVELDRFCRENLDCRI